MTLAASRWCCTAFWETCPVGCASRGCAGGERGGEIAPELCTVAQRVGRGERKGKKSLDFQGFRFRSKLFFFFRVKLLPLGRGVVSHASISSAPSCWLVCGRPLGQPGRVLVASSSLSCLQNGAKFRSNYHTCAGFSSLVTMTSECLHGMHVYMIRYVCVLVHS